MLVNDLGRNGNCYKIERRIVNLKRISISVSRDLDIKDCIKEVEAIGIELE